MSWGTIALSTPVAVLGGLLALFFGFTTAAMAHRSVRLGRHAERASRHREEIRKRRRASELNRSNAYRTGIRNAAAPILLTSANGDILAASPSVIEMFGYRDEEELRQVSMQGLYVNPSDRSLYLSATLLEQGHIRSREFRMKHRDGHHISVLTSVRVVDAPDGSSCYEGILTDVTEMRAAFEERQQLTSQLHLARKLELIGRLASGIAHEINTPMQFIGDNISFLKTAFEKLAAQLNARAPNAASQLQALLVDVSEALEGSQEGVHRVSETVRAMKEFAHPEDLEVTSTDLNQAIRTTLVVARNEYKHAAEVALELGDIPPVDCRRAEVNKVFLNLIVNAAHAIEQKNGGGRGTITIRSTVEGSYVRIDVADSGCGIPPAVLPRIFDPFFTTKAVGKGSGQGLAIARTVVKSHGGDLTVASTVGQGTTFTITFPVPVSTPQRRAAAATLSDLEDSIG